jgi:hypothetical protein
MNTENTIIFTIARMNPPTSGHTLLIKQMITQALSRGLSQINIILSSTIDDKKNPLDCNEKRTLLSDSSEAISMIDYLKEQMKREDPRNARQIDMITVKIICLNDDIDPKYGSSKYPSPRAINYMLGEFYGYPRPNLNAILVIGEDRISDYDFIKKSLGEKPVPVILDIFGLPRPEGAMSATEIRNNAVNNEFPQFRDKMAVTGLTDEKIEQIYRKIRDRISPPKPKKETAKKGGKKYKRKTNKTSRKHKKRTNKNINKTRTLQSRKYKKSKKY